MANVQKLLGPQLKALTVSQSFVGPAALPETPDFLQSWQIRCMPYKSETHTGTKFKPLPPSSKPPAVHGPLRAQLPIGSGPEDPSDDSAVLSHSSLELPSLYGEAVMIILWHGFSLTEHRNK